MTNITYSVVLDDSIVNEAKELCLDYGGKLSPLLNKLLAQWVAQKKSQPGKKDKNKDKAKDAKPAQSKTKKEDDGLFGNIDIMGDDVLK